MDAAAQAGWDKWVKSHIDLALVRHEKQIIDATVQFVVERENAHREALGHMLTRVLRLEAERDGRALSQVGGRVAG